MTADCTNFFEIFGQKDGQGYTLPVGTDSASPECHAGC
jgi:hypothetical protein